MRTSHAAKKRKPPPATSATPSKPPEMRYGTSWNRYALWAAPYQPRTMASSPSPMAVAPDTSSALRTSTAGRRRTRSTARARSASRAPTGARWLWAPPLVLRLTPVMCAPLSVSCPESDVVAGKGGGGEQPHRPVGAQQGQDHQPGERQADDDQPRADPPEQRHRSAGQGRYGSWGPRRCAGGGPRARRARRARGAGGAGDEAGATASRVARCRGRARGTRCRGAG